MGRRKEIEGMGRFKKKLTPLQFVDSYMKGEIDIFLTKKGIYIKWVGPKKKKKMKYLIDFYLWLADMYENDILMFVFFWIIILQAIIGAFVIIGTFSIVACILLLNG